MSCNYIMWYLVSMLLQVKGIVRSNINKVAERGDKLDDIAERAGMDG